MNNPLISVIVPVYNVEKYLERCLQSILLQTYSNFELLLINDGSTDNSGNISNYFASLDKRIKVIHKLNGGLSDARNTGLDIAKGSYVLFVDSDDWVEKDMIEFLHNLIVNAEADKAQCSLIKVKYSQEKIIKASTIKSEVLIGTENILLHFFAENLISSVVCDKLFSMMLFQNLRFPLRQNLEDAFILSDVFTHAHSIIVSNSIKYYYFQRDGSIMNIAKNLRHMKSSFLAYKNRIKVSTELNSRMLINYAQSGLA